MTNRGKRISILRWTVALGLLLCAPVTTIADEVTHRAAAEELLAIMNVEENLQRTMDQMLELQVKQRPQLAPLKPVIGEFYKKHMGYSALKEDLIRLYQEEFSEAELRETIGFYSTPTGMKIVNKIPTLLSRGSELGLRRVQEHLPELQAAIKAEVEKTQKTGATEAPEPSKTK